MKIQKWNYYENRVKELFYTDDNREKTDGKKTELIVIVGNHDVGFHYDMRGFFK
jgi:metallophosphoesterase superfamily enzyme